MDRERREHRRRLPALGVVVVCALTGTACDSTRGVAREAQQLTLPDRATVSDLTGPVRDGRSVQYTWDFEVTSTMSDYVRALEQRVIGHYEIAERDASRIVLRRRVNGDVYRIELRFTPMDRPISVHGVFIAAAD